MQKKKDLYKDHKDASYRIKQQVRGYVGAATDPTDITDLKNLDCV